MTVSAASAMPPGQPNNAMKIDDADTTRAIDIQRLEEFGAESEEVIRAAERSKDKFSGDQGSGYRVWHCNGVPIGIHTLKKRS